MNQKVVTWLSRLSAQEPLSHLAQSETEPSRAQPLSTSSLEPATYGPAEKELDDLPGQVIGRPADAEAMSGATVIVSLCRMNSELSRAWCIYHLCTVIPTLAGRVSADFTGAQRTMRPVELLYTLSPIREGSRCPNRPGAPATGA